MLKVINSVDMNELKKHVKLNEKQQDGIKRNIPFSRFWKIKELDNIGITSYKKIFNYCYEMVNGGDGNIQLSFFDR